MDQRQRLAVEAVLEGGDDALERAAVGAAELLEELVLLRRRRPDVDVRALELDSHPFFVATLFQPERAALRGDVPPLVNALVRAAA